MLIHAARFARLRLQVINGLQRDVVSRLLYLLFKKSLPPLQQLLASSAKVKAVPTLTGI